MANGADPLVASRSGGCSWRGAGTVVLDLVTKLIAEATLLRTPGVSVFGDWFQLRLVYNQGAAFGLHVGPVLPLDLLHAWRWSRSSCWPGCRAAARSATGSGSSRWGWWPAARWEI